MQSTAVILLSWSYLTSRQPLTPSITTSSWKGCELPVAWTVQLLHGSDLTSSDADNMFAVGAIIHLSLMSSAAYHKDRSSDLSYSSMQLTWHRSLPSMVYRCISMPTTARFMTPVRLLAPQLCRPTFLSPSTTYPAGCVRIGSSLMPIRLR